jgi:DNA invertase Pin-like site-specific DNA recombinase
MYRAADGGLNHGVRQKVVRAAVYCRVSTDESLHLEFNSLHAQREACEAYIKSQQHEGWLLTIGSYDDGGYSGGTMERPALKRLLDEVASGRVDVIVVYKIDRLTRALSDFARIVDVLDRSKASFVSITQSFNTTTSMGRLTLNVLLSFAQFEREVGAERVRDKIAASKKKGMWMGGVCPLGYDVNDRKLMVNETEAQSVRTIFELYLQLGSVLSLEAELGRRGICSKRRVRSDGSSGGGKPLTRGPLYSMLQNRMYIGQVCHRGTAYPGQHAGIVDEALFAEAQALLASNRAGRHLRTNAEHLALLTGLVWDSVGRRMSPTHTVKGPARYRYYSTRPDEADPRALTRVAAADLEQLVAERLAGLLRDRRALHDALEPFEADAVMLEAVLFAATAASQRMVTGSRREARELVVQLVSRIEVLADEVWVHVRPSALLRLTDLAVPDAAPALDLELVVPVRLFRRAREVRLAIAPGAAADTPAKDPALIKLITKGWAARCALMNFGGASLKEVAAANDVEPGYFAVLVKLGFLAPDLIAAILAGTQPQALTRQRLARLRSLPIAWTDQRILMDASA